MAACLYFVNADKQKHNNESFVCLLFCSMNNVPANSALLPYRYANLHFTAYHKLFNNTLEA